MKRIAELLCLLLCLFVAACSDNPAAPAPKTEWTTAKVAVVLPMNDGLDTHWKRTLGLFSEYMETAFRHSRKGVRLEYEWYDETAADIAALSEELAGREDLTAVIGGLYSSNTQTMAPVLTEARKPFFTLATTEELVRAHSAAGWLWAMTETDITQCEVLLAKAHSYGAKSVALLAHGEDAYGKTFIDWFAFQATELGLDVKGVFGYDAASLDAVSAGAAASGADFVICVPSEIADIRPMLEAFHSEAVQHGTAPRTLFSDTAFGADVPATLGHLGEGMEGVTFGADPESGFEISYETFFGTTPTLGEAQVYDAAMLLTYGCYYRLLHPEADLREALRRVVSGRELTMGSWMAGDMRLVIDALTAGGSPDVCGASGPLDFDAKVYTNVLRTTYCHFKLYNGRYITLDYITADGSMRTDATLAAWNRQAHAAQELGHGAERTYPATDKRWALLVAGSTGWGNYRHQADVLALYQLLRRHGYADERIVLVMEDDIARHSRNPRPGTVCVSPGGENLYTDVRVDYRLSDLRPEDIGLLLNGRRSDRLPEVIQADADDNVLVFWSGHGKYGQLMWADEYVGFTDYMARDAFREMADMGRFRKLLCLVETCYSGSVARHCEGIPGALFITAAAENETSKADVWSEEMGVWMTNRFTATLREQIAENPRVALSALYYRLFMSTVGSHVRVYNVEQYGNPYTETMGDFLEGLGKENNSPPDLSSFATNDEIPTAPKRVILSSNSLRPNNSIMTSIPPSLQTCHPEQSEGPIASCKPTSHPVGVRSFATLRMTGLEDSWKFVIGNAAKDLTPAGWFLRDVLGPSLCSG